jgi:SAM-dependent methyltransferase
MSVPPLTFNAWLRHDLIWDTLGGLPPETTVLEIGAGEGAMGARLAGRFCYVGVEPDPHSFAKARARIEALGLGRMVQGDPSVLDPDQAFDVVCAFEVLEHIQDDQGALRAWKERLRPGGRLLLSVPAYQKRFGPSDSRVGHFRRYDPEQMRSLLLSAGYTRPVIRMYGFPLAYALEWCRNAIARVSAARGSTADRTSASGRWLQPPERLGALTEILTAPMRFLQRPFAKGGLGTGLVVIAQRGA